jgi:hypothetical protein
VLIAGWIRSQLCDPQPRMISYEPVTLKKHGAAICSDTQELESAHERALVCGGNQR